VRRSALLVATVLVAAQMASAKSFLVKNANDSGSRSLRDAITKANIPSAPDYITFAPALSGKTITLVSALPALSDPDTYLDGDLDDDGRPDITIDGVSMDIAGGGDGLHMAGAWMIIDGLAIVRCPGNGIYVDGAPDCLIKGCHVGVSLAGTANLPNGNDQIQLRQADRAFVGSPLKRNIISAGNTTSAAGIIVRDTQRAVIGWNYIGLTRDGSGALGAALVGVSLYRDSRDCRDNTVRDCLFAGMTEGVHLWGAVANKVFGCTFGLAADGETLLAPDFTEGGVVLGRGSTDNLIGGDTVAERNVFTGARSRGVFVTGDGADRNRIQGNYFGTNAAGDAQRGLGVGVLVAWGAGAQTIGGATDAVGNYFTPRQGEFAVNLDWAGMNSTIRNNWFGDLPAATPRLVSTGGVGVHVGSTSARILENSFCDTVLGIWTSGAAATPDIYGNTFRRCGIAVAIGNDAHPRLGNLANASTTDDGGNIFRNSSGFDIQNETPNTIRAEGNDSGTTVKWNIDWRIWDQLDNAASGRVDFSPLAGGIIPSGRAGNVSALAITGAAAVPTAAGAEVLFTLSAPAEVTVEVLNMAGRPVAVLAQDRAADAGVQRLAWNGRSATGTVAPAGRYLIRVAARSAAGHQATALAPVRLGR